MVRFGLVGTGYWAETVHAPGLAAHPHVEFVGVWGRDSVKSSALARKHEVQTFDSSDELFEAVDAVSFAVAPDVQAELAVGAARTGCDLLLEKPTALSVDAADRLADAAAAVRSIVFFTGRFAPPTQRWFDEVVGRHWDGGSFRWILPTAALGSPYAGSRWRAERGALWDVVPHALAFFLPALGPVSQIARVSGRDGAVVLGLGHGNGSVSSIVVSQTAAARDTEIVLWGPDGVDRAPARGPEHFPAAYGAAIDALVGSGSTVTVDAAFGAEVVRILASAEMPKSQR